MCYVYSLVGELPGVVRTSTQCSTNRHEGYLEGNEKMSLDIIQD